ncbi:hypothetical protein JG688_00003754, partial [Phytophthora aleatoria]
DTWSPGKLQTHPRCPSTAPVATSGGKLSVLVGKLIDDHPVAASYLWHRPRHGGAKEYAVASTWDGWTRGGLHQRWRTTCWWPATHWTRWSAGRACKLQWRSSSDIGGRDC